MIVEETYIVEGRREPWPVAWSSVWVGALTAVATSLIIGLIGYALGAHQLATAAFDWRNLRLGSAIFSIAGAFFAFVIAGWVTAKMAGFRRAEPAMLHGAITWLLTIPFFMVLGALGAGAYFGGWYAGLGNPVAAPDPAAATAFRNTAIATAVAMLLGLVGSTLGSWMGSGEPMSLGYYRHRDHEITPERPRRAA
jgi:hypothetical protein